MILCLPLRQLRQHAHRRSNVSAAQRHGPVVVDVVDGRHSAHPGDEPACVDRAEQHQNAVAEVACSLRAELDLV